jgi:glycosyltransferase involved in cell wall biosynthesis
VEGTASGKAGIASQTRPRSEQIDDAVNGLPCDPMDSASIGKGLIVCLRRSELRRALGQVARQTAGDRFSLPILTENDERFYQLCMS